MRCIEVVLKEWERRFKNQIQIFPSGGLGGGEVEDCNQGGADFLPHARSAGDVGRLHKVGHVCRECSLQSLSQER